MGAAALRARGLCAGQLEPQVPGQARGKKKKKKSDPREAVRWGWRAAAGRANDSTCKARELKVSDT